MAIGHAIGQSFFDPLPAGADLYLLKNLLADWPDREARTILSVSPRPPSHNAASCPGRRLPDEGDRRRRNF